MIYIMSLVSLFADVHNIAVSNQANFKATSNVRVIWLLSANNVPRAGLTSKHDLQRARAGKGATMSL